MVFLGGPRQVGKTTLAQTLIPQFYDGHPAYFNWDNPEHRAQIRIKGWPIHQKFIILDEIHKLKQWRNLVKGIYDTQKNTHQFMVTGSARLDHFRKGGDSLLGRYHYYRLHPYSLPELGVSRAHTLRLLQYGGFPEPLAAQDERGLRRWHLSRLQRLIRTDVRDLENIQDLDKMELLAETLSSRVGAPLSYRNLAQDLELDPKTCRKWVDILDAMYFCFRLSPFGAPKIKAVKKEQKLYLWDWSQIEDPGARFENMVASHLLKFCHYHEDVNGYRMELRYLRDTEKREVDFVVLKQNKPLFAVECKLSSKAVGEQIHYFKRRTTIPKFYQVHLGEKAVSPTDGVFCLPFEKFVELESLV